MHGGDRVAEVISAHGVQFVFTLTGGHISPILVGCKQRGIRVVDTRHEATAVFAADAVARLSGVPGVAVVTAGPGVTNTVTAVKNAQLAQSPVVVIGGAAATALKGRGALQDIDQMALLRSAVKWSRAVKRVKEIIPALEAAFYKASSDVPGPVFVELPVDLLYDETLVRAWYGRFNASRGLAAKITQRYLTFHIDRLFSGAERMKLWPLRQPQIAAPQFGKVRQVTEKLRKAHRPLLLVGSQAMLDVPAAEQVAAAVEQVNMPVYLSGMARGLLGRDHPLQMRHNRRNALREADFVILAGLPVDFRLDYGEPIRRSATFVSANRSRTDLKKNRRPDIAIPGDPGLFLRRLAELMPSNDRWLGWQNQLCERDDVRNAEIRKQMQKPVEENRVNPLHLLAELEASLDKHTILIGDGGDFVATASYILQPPGPLAWLDPGPFGTLGVGAGFALGAKLCHPEANVWIIYGDGSCGFSLAEFDTFVRHNTPIIALVGNDACWTEIAREQMEIFRDDVATTLAHTDYHRVAEGFGATGIKLDNPKLSAESIARAKQIAAGGSPVLINAILGKTDFRKGSVSV